MPRPNFDARKIEPVEPQGVEAARRAFARAREDKPMNSRTLLSSVAALALAGFVVTGCAAPSGGGGSQSPQQTSQEGLPPTVPIEASQARRLQEIMKPLIANMNQPLPANQVRVQVWDDPQINAANAGGGEFYITTGLLNRGTDNQIRAIMAHEVAHADLGHVARAQGVATGIGIGISLLDQIFPGAQALTPIAGQLAFSAYSRGEETSADAHGKDILDRAGYEGKELMISTLTWLGRESGGGGGGFFSTHPATGDRLAALERLPD